VSEPLYIAIAVNGQLVHLPARRDAVTGETSFLDSLSAAQLAEVAGFQISGARVRVIYETSRGERRDLAPGDVVQAHDLEVGARFSVIYV
jgi:hypothetical protein